MVNNCKNCDCDVNKFRTFSCLIMIFIFSKVSDISTNSIIDWLHYYNEPFVRINEENSDSIEYETLFKKISGKTIFASLASEQDAEKDVFWFRRPDSIIVSKLSNKEIELNKITYPNFSDAPIYFNSLNLNYKYHLRTFLHLILDNPANRIGSYYKNSLNKIEVLQKAAKIGIYIPPYIVTGDFKKLKSFFHTHNNDIICKNLYEIVHPKGNIQAGFLLRCLTTQITDLSTLSQEFFPSLFQKNIHKEFEIRSFFLNGKFYSCAMFTQENGKTMVDFRDSDRANPTRIVPYQLDKTLEEKLLILMEAIGLDTGSIDIIKGKDGQYYFLEINPVGQFGFVSKPCNYNFEKLIAKTLINKQNGGN